MPPASIASVSALIATLETPISRPEASPRTTPWQIEPRRRTPEANRAQPAPTMHRLEAGERGDRVALVLARVRDGDGQEGEPGGGEPEAEPLAAVEPVAEVALGREGDQHQAPGDHGLDQRQRGDRHRGDVEDPGDRGDREADRPPAGPKQGREALQRAPEPDRQAPRRRRGACRASRGSPSRRTRVPALCQVWSFVIESERGRAGLNLPPRPSANVFWCSDE